MRLQDRASERSRGERDGAVSRAPRGSDRARVAPFTSVHSLSILLLTSTPRFGGGDGVDGPVAASPAPRSIAAARPRAATPRSGALFFAAVRRARWRAARFDARVESRRRREEGRARTPRAYRRRRGALGSSGRSRAGPPRCDADAERAVAFSTVFPFLFRGRGNSREAGTDEQRPSEVSEAAKEGRRAYEHLV